MMLSECKTLKQIAAWYAGVMQCKPTKLRTFAWKGVLLVLLINIFIIINQKSVSGHALTREMQKYILIWCT